VTYYAKRALYEIENGKQLYDLEVPEGCPTPREELSYTFDPRCRPWFLSSKKSPYKAVMTTFSSIDG